VKISHVNPSPCVSSFVTQTITCGMHEGKAKVTTYGIVYKKIHGHQKHQL